jgi:hypothetical protein
MSIHHLRSIRETHLPAAEIRQRRFVQMEGEKALREIKRRKEKGESRKQKDETATRSNPPPREAAAQP